MGADENGIFDTGWMETAKYWKGNWPLPGISNLSYLALSQNGTGDVCSDGGYGVSWEWGGGVCAIKCRENPLEILNSKRNYGHPSRHVTPG